MRRNAVTSQAGRVNPDANARPASPLIHSPREREAAWIVCACVAAGAVFLVGTLFIDWWMG